MIKASHSASPVISNTETAYGVTQPLTQGPGESVVDVWSSRELFQLLNPLSTERPPRSVGGGEYTPRGLCNITHRTSQHFIPPGFMQHHTL